MCRSSARASSCNNFNPTVQLMSQTFLPVVLSQNLHQEECSSNHTTCPCTTTVMPSCTVSLKKSPDGYRWCSTPPLVLSSALASMTTSRRLFAMFSTGCQYLSGLSSRSLFLRSTVSVVLALPTSKMSACWCRILLLGALSVRRSVVTCLFLEQDEAQSTEFHGGCSSRLEFTTGSLTITTDKSNILF